MSQKSKELSDALNYYEETKKAHLQDLKDLVKIPSISFDGFPAEEVRKSAHAVESLLKSRGLENVKILEIPGAHPYVYGDWLHAPGKPTVLLYAHHDVQPIGNPALWKTPPFEPTEKDGRLYGRGTADDKAGIVVHTATIASYLKTCGKLPINVKVVIEGEEECGSDHLTEFLKTYRDLLSADAMILTDTQNYDRGLPSLTVALRGLVSFDVEVKSMVRSVHSGMWGGPTPDAAMALCKMLASVTDTEGRLQIPGVWDEVEPVQDSAEKEIAELPFSIPEFRDQAGLLPNTKILPARDGNVKPLQQMWYEPSFSINGIEVGNRKAAANAIHGSAWARVGIRLVPNMNPERTAQLLCEHLRRVAPWGVEVKVTPEGAGTPAWMQKSQGEVFELALKALENGYGKKPVLMGCGGTIPFVQPFSDALGGAPALLIGVEDPYTYAHSENESMPIDDFEKCIKSMIYFYDFYGKS